MEAVSGGTWAGINGMRRFRLRTFLREFFRKSPRVLWGKVKVFNEYYPELYVQRVRATIETFPLVAPTS